MRRGARGERRRADGPQPAGEFDSLFRRVAGERGGVLDGDRGAREIVESQTMDRFAEDGANFSCLMRVSSGDHQLDHAPLFRAGPSSSRKNTAIIGPAVGWDRRSWEAQTSNGEPGTGPPGSGGLLFALRMPMFRATPGRRQPDVVCTATL